MTELQPTPSACPRCGYLHAAGARDSRCSECGLLIEPAIAADFLRVADREWVDRLLVGCRWIRASTMLGLCSFLSILIVSFSRQHLPADNAQPWRDALLGALLDALAWSAVAATCVVPIALTVGLVRLFAADPFAQPTRTTTARRAVNFVVMPIAALWVVSSMRSIGFGFGFTTNWIPLIGAGVLAAHVLAITSLRDDVRKRCESGVQRRGACPLLFGGAVIACAAVIVVVALTGDEVWWKLLWIVWVVAVTDAARVLAPLLRAEIAARGT